MFGEDPEASAANQGQMLQTQVVFLNWITAVFLGVQVFSELGRLPISAVGHCWMVGALRWMDVLVAVEKVGFQLRVLGEGESGRFERAALTHESQQTLWGACTVPRNAPKRALLSWNCSQGRLSCQ